MFNAGSPIIGWKIKLTAVLIAGLSLASVGMAQENKLITATSAGVVKLGMTVKQVRDAIKLPLERTIIADGVPALLIKNGEKDIMIVTNGNGDLTKDEDTSTETWKINESAKIDFIQVFDPSYRTAAGVHAGMTIAAVEKIYGKLKEITESEIEQEEYADFIKAPKSFSFRVSGKDSGKAGIYARNKASTVRYTAGAYIEHIELRGN